MKFKAEIEIDLPDDIANEWEPVAFRVPTSDDHFLAWWGIDQVAHATGRHLIIRRRFQWPAFVLSTVRFITWDVDYNRVHFWSHRPEWSNAERWIADGDAFIADSEAIDLPFPGGDWTTRIEENPNWKGDA